MKLNILYIHQYFNTPEMAGGTRSYETAKRLVNFGHKVEIITTDRESTTNNLFRTEEREGIILHYINCGYNNSMSFRRRIFSFIYFAFFATIKSLTLKPQIIFATSTPLTVAFPCLAAKAIKKIPYIFEVRDLWPAVPIAIGAIKNPLLIFFSNLLEKLAYTNALHVITLAPGMKKALQENGINKSKISVIPNACDTNSFKKILKNESLTKLKSNFDWIKSSKLVLFAGSFGLVNGVSYIPRLAKEVYRLDKSIKFVLIGGGREEKDVKEIAFINKTYKKNVFIFKKIPKNELIPWMFISDMHICLFCGPRVIWKDAVQNKFFDALTCGKPVACNFDGWQTKIADEHKVGIFLDPKNYKEAAKNLVDHINNVQWMKNASKNSLILAKDKFNRDKLVEKVNKTIIKKYCKFAQVKSLNL